MPHGVTVEVIGLTKVYGAVTAVRDVSFRAEPGRVTGFLGPNGAGKTSTLRILLGLNRATSGEALIGGQRYRDLSSPTQQVGGSLSADVFHPGRSARDHLRVMAVAAGIAPARVDRVLRQVGLSEAGRRSVGGYSLGMRQRLGLATALLGDPGVLVLDEPINGLDPDGIRWIRTFLRELAAEGRTVLLSSHVLSEVKQTVDDVVVIRRGEVVMQGALTELSTDTTRVLVDAVDRDALRRALTSGETSLSPTSVESADNGLLITGMTAEQVGRRALAAGVALRHLSDESEGLESIFLRLTADTVADAHPTDGVEGTS